LLYHKAIDLDPKDATAYTNLGHALSAQKDYAGAVANYHKAIELDPKYATAYTNLGVALSDQKDYTEAVIAFKKAIELAPNLPNPYGALGTTLLKQGSFHAAKEAAQKALSLLPPGHPLGKLALQLHQEAERRLAIDAREKGDPLDLAAVRAGISGKLTADDLLDGFSSTQQSFRKGHLVQLKAGSSYQIDLAGDFDTLLRIENAQQQPLLWNDDVCPPQNLNARLVFTPAQDGLYRLIVNSAEPKATGSYTLKVQPVVPAGEPKHFSGELTRADPLDKGKFVHKHKVALTAGTPYCIELKSARFDTYLVLLATEGQRVLAENNDIVPGDTNSRLDITPQQSGEYVLVVTSCDPGQTGPYTLEVQGYGPKNKAEGK
jgi:hypothetical protein